LRKLNLASAVVDHFFRVNLMMLTPNICAGGAEREDAFVSDHVVSFTLREALGWRVLMASGADEVKGDVGRYGVWGVIARLTCCDKIAVGED
jgi:hypothetical protein